MKEGIVVRSKFGSSSPCTNPSVRGLASPMSIPSLEIKKKKHLYRNVLLDFSGDWIRPINPIFQL